MIFRFLRLTIQGKGVYFRKNLLVLVKILAAICSKIVAKILNPDFLKKKRKFEISNSVYLEISQNFELVSEMTKSFLL